MCFDDFVATAASLAGLALSLSGAAAFLAFKVAPPAPFRVRSHPFDRSRRV